MKKIMMIAAALAFTISVGAQQPVDNGIKKYNYQMYISAQNILAPLAATDPLANYYLGLTYLAQGDVAKASATFSKYPDDPANISGTARVAFANKDAAKGMQIAKDLAAKARRKEWMPEKYAADAITYSTGGDYQQAIAWYTDVLTKTDDLSAHLGLGDAYRKTPGGGGEAMNNYEHITEKDPNNSLGFSRIGDLWYEAKNYPSALDNYTKAKNADSTNPLPYKALANAYSFSGKYPQALQNLKIYLRLSDNTKNDKLEYLRAAYLAQSYCEAAQLAAQEINDFSDAATKTEITGILGFSQSHCGDSVQALKNIQLYFQMQNPKNIKPEAYIELGKLYMKMGMLDSAGVYYTKGISGDTAANKTDVYREIAEAYKTKKDYCKSADWYDNLVKANPATQPLDYTWRGIMYYYCGDYTKATNAFSEFAVKYPTVPYAVYWQGRTAAAIDSDATTGGAVHYFTKWLDTVGANYEKKNDMKGAYEYLMYYYYNTKDKDKENQYKELIKAIDPNDKALKSLEEMEKEANTPKKTPVKGKK